MSSPLIQVTVALTFGASIATQTGAAYGSTSVVVTDSTGVAQAAVDVTPASPSFTASVAPGAGSVTAQDLDVNGVALGSPVTQSFTEAGSPPSFTPTTGITVTPAGAASAALRKR